MEPKEILDFHRMFFGDLHYGFLLEVVVRTIIVYLYTIMLLRFLGKRSMGQLSTLELAIIISFGSAVGDPMLNVEVPILHGLVVITTIAFLQVGIEYWINQNKKLETFMEGQADCLVKNGLILPDALSRNNLSHEDLYRFLRGKGVEHLGEVKHAFFETSGMISVWCFSKSEIKPGLGILPEEHIDDDAYQQVQDKAEEGGHYSCTACGYTHRLRKGQHFKPCANCGQEGWIKAVVPEQGKDLNKAA